MSTSRDEMDTLAAYELAWSEEGDGIEAAVAHCGCGGACESCRTSIERVERRAEALISVDEMSKTTETITGSTVGAADVRIVPEAR